MHSKVKTAKEKVAQSLSISFTHNAKSIVGMSNAGPSVYTKVTPNLNIKMTN